MMGPTTHQPPASPTPLGPTQHPQRSADADAGPGTTAPEPSTTTADVQDDQVALHYFRLQLDAAVAQNAGITTLRMSTT